MYNYHIANLHLTMPLIIIIICTKFIILTLIYFEIFIIKYTYKVISN